MNDKAKKTLKVLGVVFTLLGFGCDFCKGIIETKQQSDEVQKAVSDEVTRQLTAILTDGESSEEEEEN